MTLLKKTKVWKKTKTKTRRYMTDGMYVTDVYVLYDHPCNPCTTPVIFFFEEVKVESGTTPKTKTVTKKMTTAVTLMHALSLSLSLSSSPP